MRYSTRRSGNWPWGLLGVGACLLGTVTQLCAQAEPGEPRYRPRSIVFVLDMSGPPPPIATDDNQIPGTYDVYQLDGDKTGLALVLSGDVSTVWWTLKGTPMSGRVDLVPIGEDPDDADIDERGLLMVGDFSIAGQEKPAFASIWVWPGGATEASFNRVKGDTTHRSWTYRLKKRAGTDEQEAAGAHRDVPRDERLAEWLTRAIEVVENAIRRGAEWEWAVITCKNHQAYLQQPFTDEIDLSALTVRASGSTSDRPLVWAVAQAVAYLYKHGRHPTGQIIVMSNGMDLCDDRSPRGGAEAVKALNDQLRSLKLPGRSPSTGGGTRRSQRFGTVDLLPIGAGLLRQGAAGEVLGAAGETIDDMLPRVQALIEGSDKQVTVSVVTTNPTLSEQDVAALRSIAEAGGGHFSAAATPDDVADVVSQVIGLPDPTPEGPGGEEPDPGTPGGWTTHRDEAHTITMQIAPGWTVGKGVDEVMFEVRGPVADGEKHEGALVRLAIDEGQTLDGFIAQAGQWVNDQVGRECEMQRGATLRCPAGDVATLRFTDPESPESYVLAFVTLGKSNGYILGFQGPQGDEESVRADLEKMAESMQVP